MTLSLPTDFPRGERDNVIVLDGMSSPGVGRVKGTGPGQKWDERQGYGLSTGIVFTSMGLAKLTWEFMLWEPAQYLAWLAFAAAKLQPPAFGARPTSMSIVHALLNAPPYGITQVVVDGGIPLLEQDEQGLWTGSIPLQQYRPVRPLFVVKPLEGPPGAPGADVAPKSAQELQIEQLTQSVNALSR